MLTDIETGVDEKYAASAPFTTGHCQRNLGLNIFESFRTRPSALQGTQPAQTKYGICQEIRLFNFAHHVCATHGGTLHAGCRSFKRRTGRALRATPIHKMQVWLTRDREQM